MPASRSRRRYGPAAGQARRRFRLSHCCPRGGGKMRKRSGALSALVVTAVLAISIGIVGASAASQSIAASSGGTGEFVVFYADGANAAAARAAISAAGGTVVDEIAQLGLARVSTGNARFSETVTASAAIRSIVRNHS